MNKLRDIFIICFFLGLLSTPFLAYADQTTNISTYYPSPSGNYTKISLVNGTGGPNENSTGLNPCFCAQYTGNSTGIKSGGGGVCDVGVAVTDRKSTRLNS